MDVADTIAVLNEGRVEQIGTPLELYERPANDFVMSFLGPVARLRGRLVRPHDLRVSREPAPDAVPATVGRIAHLGFEVRVELDADDERVYLQTARPARLALASG